MNKRGFTLIELLVSFALITIVSLSLFKTVLTVQKKSIKDLAYNQYLTFASSFSNNIQKDFTGDKITSFSSCGNNCYEIVYESAGTKEIKIDRTNNTMSYGSINEKLPSNYIFYGDLILELNKIEGMATDNYNSILTLKVPIKSNLTDEYSNIIYTYQYDDRQGEAPAAVFHTLIVDPNGGIYSGTTSNTTYYLMENTSQDLNIPMKQNSIFNGWTKTCSSCLTDNTYTIGTADDTLTAQWLALASAYTYTGSSTVESDASGNWKIKFLTSGTFTPLVNMSIDVFLVGGGASGGGSSNGGGGGGGGYTKTVSDISLVANTPYNVTVGAGGDYAGDQRHDGAASYFDTHTASGGYCATSSYAVGGNGGSGGGRGGTSSTSMTGYPGAAYGNNATVSTGQGSTTCEFGEGTLSACNSGVTLYSGGGGGYGRVGGAGGGGNGRNAGDQNGVVNTGGGGGGGKDSYVGVGGSGIVIIRNKR